MTAGKAVAVSPFLSLSLPFPFPSFAFLVLSHMAGEQSSSDGSDLFSLSFSSKLSFFPFSPSFSFFFLTLTQVISNRGEDFLLQRREMFAAKLWGI